MTVPGVYSPSQGLKHGSKQLVAWFWAIVWLITAVVGSKVYHNVEGAAAALVISSIWQVGGLIISAVEKRP